MEDDGFIDDDLIDDIAREYVGRYGLGSVSLLRERALIAQKVGDFLAAQAWTDAADAAGRILD